MAILDILHYPDQRLRTKAQPVAVVDQRIRDLISDMFETMYAAPGIGLAATQVDVHERVIVLDVSEDRANPVSLVNPELLMEDGVEEMEEGCLSVPGVYELVSRAERIRVRGLDADGNPAELDADGMFAVCIQHEMDHLEGKLFVDYLSQLKRGRIRKRIEKDQRHELRQVL